MGQFCSAEYWCWGIFESTFLLDSFITLVEKVHRPRLYTHCTASFYYYWKRSQIISSMTKYWRGHYLSCPKTNYWGHATISPGFGAYYASVIGNLVAHLQLSASSNAIARRLGYFTIHTPRLFSASDGTCLVISAVWTCTDCRTESTTSGRSCCQNDDFGLTNADHTPEPEWPGTSRRADTWSVVYKSIHWQASTNSFHSALNIGVLNVARNTQNSRDLRIGNFRSNRITNRIGIYSFTCNNNYYRWTEMCRFSWFLKQYCTIAPTVLASV